MRHIRVPEHLLTPLDIPVLQKPVTVKSLLLHCRMLEDNTVKANERFLEIKGLQE